jgi:hypothetical protein
MKIFTIMILVVGLVVGAVGAQDDSTLTIWTRFNTDNPQVSSDVWLADLLVGYAADSDVRIDNTFYPFDQINTTLNIAVQTGTNVPDAAYIDTEQLSFFYNNGTLTDLTEFVRGADWFEDVDPASLATCTAPDGAILCVPSTTSNYYMYYWTAAYPEGFPATTTAFLAAAPGVRAGGVYPMTFKAAEPVSVERFYTGLLRSYGVPLAGEEGEALWATDEAVEAVGFVRTLFAEDYVPRVALAPQFEYEEPFKQGEAASFVATGARPRLLGIPGEAEMYGGKGVTTCATCDGAFYRDMDVVVVGGGDSAAEEALFLTRFCSKVTLIHRRDELRASQIMADRATSHEKIEMAWNSAPTEILADEKGFTRAIVVRDTQTGGTREIPCKGVFIAIGHIPNTDFVEGLLERDGDGYIVPESGSQVKTGHAGFFAAGDCVDHVYRQAITAAGMGCEAAIDAERWLAEHG